MLVYVPASYHTHERAYPVLYMQDGQNLFDQYTSFGGVEWGVDETMQTLGGDGLEAIVVGVPNMGAERLAEYSPFVDPAEGGGAGDRYIDFLSRTLKPAIDERFRTLPDRDQTGIAGSSMGALISLYAFFRAPSVFGFAGVLSPSLWFAGEAIFSWVESAPFVPGRIYLDIGAPEGAAHLARARQMRDLLCAKGYQLHRDLRWLESRCGRHDEASWARRFARALPFLLGREDAR